VIGIYYASFRILAQFKSPIGSGGKMCGTCRAIVLGCWGGLHEGMVPRIWGGTCRVSVLGFWGGSMAGGLVGPM